MTARTLSQLFYWMFALAFFASCGSDGTGSSGENEANQPTDTTPPPPVYTLSPFSESPAFSDATIKMAYKDSTFKYTIGGNYKLGDQTPDAPQKMCANSKDGQHIHLIIDDQPYIAKYEPSFIQSVPDGEHYVLSFLSRSYHESIKTKTAHTAVKASFAGNNIKSSSPIADPMLFYSRPKGNYVGKAETDKLMLDFYLLNTTLSPTGNKVKIQINSEKEFIVDDWKPYFVEGLPMGDNKIKLTLIGPDGNPLNTPLNPVERVFTLKPDPAE